MDQEASQLERSCTVSPPTPATFPSLTCHSIWLLPAERLRIWMLPTLALIKQVKDGPCLTLGQGSFAARVWLEPDHHLKGPVCGFFAL